MRILLLLTICWCGFAPLLAAEWLGYRTGMATVYVHPGEEQIAAVVGSMAATEGQRLAKALGITRIQPFSIYAYASRGEFLRDAGARRLLVGISYRPSGMIRIDVTGIEGPVQQVLAHEMTHTLLGQRLGEHIDRLPNWVNEGMAGYFAAPVSRSQLPGLSRLWHAQGVLSLRGMEMAFDSGSDVAIAYQQSLSMIAWLEYRHPGALPRLIDALGRGARFEEAMRQIVGITPEQWLDKWRTQIPFYEAILNWLASPIIFAPVAVLIAIFAYLRMKRRDEDTPEVETSDAAQSDVLPYPVASMLVDLHTLGHDLTQYPIWDDIHTP